MEKRKQYTTLKKLNTPDGRIQHQSNQPKLNGFECPKCGAELFDSSPLLMKTSNPPMLDIHCGYCTYTGYRNM